MTDRTKPSQKAENSDSEKNDVHLPDVILDESTEEIVDLPRPGIPKDVLNVTKAASRFPDVLIGDQ